VQVHSESTAPSRTTPWSAYLTCFVIGFGGLFVGVTGPLLSTFVPPLVQNALGDHRTAIGVVMAIDNVLLLLLVPLTGAASDRASARGTGRLPLVLAGYLLAAIGMAVFPFSPTFGITGVITAMVMLYVGINAQRSPFQALIADTVPSAYRSLATGSVTFQMCVGAVVFLMLGRLLGMRPAFLIAAGTVLAIAAAFALALREPRESTARTSSSEATVASLLQVAWAAMRGTVTGLRAIFIASVLLQLTFQTFTTWYALHAIERFRMRPEDVSIGFIAWALGGVVGSLPAGFIGLRLGRRHAMLLGFALMAASLVALDRLAGGPFVTVCIGLASAAWTLPTVNAYPLFVEPIPREQRGVLSALFLLSMALGGGIGDPLNGSLFDLFGSYRPMFLMMAVYTALAFVTVLLVPRGVGEASLSYDRT
jgi:maltose/moltooligosaccharide transporter